jgi:hypothetical protein
MSDPEIDAPPSLYEQLACRLYETMERLAPGPDEYVEWGQLTQWHRDLYLNCVDALLDDPHLLARAINLRDDDVIEGTPKKGEQLDSHHQVGPSPVDSATSTLHVVKNGLIVDRRKL